MEIATINIRGLRRQVAGFSLVMLIASLFAINVAQAARFTDAQPSDWFYSAVEQLAADGLLDLSKKTYRPADNANRAEAVKLLVEMSGVELENTATTSCKDVVKGDWHEFYFATAVKHGILSGYTDKDGKPTGYCGPGNDVTRAEFAKMVAAAVPLTKNTAGSPHFTDVKEGSWFFDFVETAYNWSVVNGYGDGSFKPDSKINRAEIATMIARASEPVARAAATTTTTTTTTTETTTTVTPAAGDLSVKLSASGPVAKTLPSGATSVALAAWDFTAGSAAATLKSLELHQLGVSTLPGTSQGYLYEGNDRLTAGKTVNTTTNVMNFNNLNLTVGANATRTLILKMDTGTVTATGEVGFEIASATAVNAGDGKAVGSFPLAGGLFDLSTTAAGTLTITSNGDVANPKVGEDNATIAKFKLDATNEAAGVEIVGIYLGAGTVATADLENLELYVSGETDPIATVAAVNAKDVAQFVLKGPYASDFEGGCLNSSGYCIEKGNSKTFTVKADFNPARSSDTILAYVDETTDVLAIGDKYGFGMTVTIAGTTGYDGTTCTAASEADCTRSVVEGGDVTVTSPGPAAKDVGINGKDVVLQEFSIATAGDVTFKNFPLSLDMSETAATDGLLDGTTSNITDIKISCGESNETIWGPVDANVLTTTIGGATAITEAAGDDAESFYLFSEDHSFKAGEKLSCKVTADIRNLTTLADETIFSSVELDGTYPEIRDTNNKLVTNSTALVPSTNLIGKTMTIKSPSLTLSLAAVPVAGATTHVKGSSNLNLVGISARCGTASTCLLKDITMTCDIDDDGGNNAFTAGVHNGVNFNSITGSVALKDSTGAFIAGFKSVQSTGAVNFTSINYTIPAGNTQSIFVVGSITTGAFTDSTGDGDTILDAEDLSCGINATTDVTFEDSSGTSRNSATTVNAANEVFVRTSEGGSLTVAVDPATKKEDIVISGVVGQEISKFKFTTTAEAFLVRQLSINARQSGVASANLGDYDNNIAAVNITYTNSAGVAESKQGGVENGTAQFSGLDFLIGKDSDAVLTVSANVSSLASATGGGSAGEFIDLNIGFDSFEAVSQASGVTYKGDRIDAGVAGDSDLDFGTLTFTDGDAATDVAITAANATLGVSFALEVDDDDDASQSEEAYPVGTIFCVDEGEGGTCSGETLLVVTARADCTAAATPHASCADALEDVYTVMTIDDAGAAAITDEALLYSLPGSGYLTTSNHMHVYESKPTLTLSSSSPTGGKNVSASDNAFIFNIAANATEQVKIRAATELTAASGFDSAGTNNTALAADTQAGDQLDGSATFAALDNHLASDSVSMQSASDLSGYTRLSFWVKYTGAAVPAFSALKTNVISSATTTPDVGGVALSAAICGANTGVTTFVSTRWFNCDISIAAVAASGENFFHLEIDDSTGLTFGSDELHLDRVIAYNDKLTVNIATDTDVDTYALNTSNAGAPSETLLREGGSTVATAYWDSLTNGASATSTAKAVFIPTTEIGIAKGTTKTFTVTIDSSDLISEESGSDDPVSFSINLGTASGGAVTAGDFWWNDTNFSSSTAGAAAGTAFSLTTPGVIQWLGHVTDTALNSNTLIY